jgi:hypothetical protein
MLDSQRAGRSLIPTVFPLFGNKVKMQSSHTTFSFSALPCLACTTPTGRKASKQTLQRDETMATALYLAEREREREKEKEEDGLDYLVVLLT